MLTFKGKIIHLERNQKLFKTKIEFSDSLYSEHARFCGAMCYSILTEEYYREDKLNIPTWGYDGRCPDLLSVGILAATLGNVTSWLDMIQLLCYQYLRDDYGNPVSPRRYSWVFRKDVLRHYRAFTKEFTSQWGNEWTMTSDEVLAWIKEQECKPKQQLELQGV